MNRDLILAKLRAHEAELRTSGVARLSLFGSAARDDVAIQGTRPIVPHP